ncbi:hypothetical protein T439DRAFT_249873 [Meredithblackwellia eburnea MCA 4105]
MNDSGTFGVSGTRPFAGEGGRGEHVLVERRSLNPKDALRNTVEHRLSWDGLRSGNWGTTLLFDGPGKTSSSKRRPSPAAHPRSSKARRQTAAVEPPRTPTPPLTIDSIQSTFNPFPLFHIRWHLLPEVVLLDSALAIALYRLNSMIPTSTYSTIFPIPIAFLSITVVLVPFITLFRRPTSYFKAPFTDERGYRDPNAADDGVAAALVLPVLLAAACYWDTYTEPSPTSHIGLENIAPLVNVWVASGLNPVPNVPGSELLGSARATAQTLFKARHQLVLLTALNTGVLLLHLVMARTFLKIERLPKSNTKRFFGFMAVSGVVSMSINATFAAWDWGTRAGLPISPFEAGMSTFIQQASFYIVSRLARRGFTLGELNTMTAAGNALCLEFWRLSRSRWTFKRGYPDVPPTFRTATPIVVFQSVLIPGAFLSGFLLSPLLVISRHIAQKPSHRLKWPTERERHRRLLAAGVYLGLAGIIFLMLGGWASWVLGSKGGLRRPWLWAISFVLSGGDGIAPSEGWRWKRIILSAYWLGVLVAAVGGWQTRLVRARRIRMKNAQGSETSKTTGKGMKEGSKVGAELAREEKSFHASLNMRRKFFHALAVAMFVPGIAFDPSFTSLAFSVAFAFFTFCEYARYFALYPVGAPLHIFFSEFVDSKDSGPVILSHFYLLTGCAGGLWLEGRGVNRFTGVLILGIGDAMASVVGKLIGRLRWPGTSKTVEGTIAFVVSIMFCAWVLRFTGLTSDFSMLRYMVATTLAGLLEACSAQNDNLVIPIFMWSMVSLLNV